ncbi:glyoxalase-like domain-containing protein [Boletus coccyginus]|nr:glyoxalase-like domain-containing protein [Boletus coccyginus]
MSTPSTNILDHIIHLTPPGTVEQVSQQFRDLGFNVIAGGTHTGGLSANALVILGDDAYLELISFTHPPSHYPPGSPDRQRRDANPWAQKEPGWIDFSFLGTSTTSIARIINARAERDQSGIHYAPESDGGRTRTDGQVLQWVISAAENDQLRGTVPFFCGDVTPRNWRVPVEPPSNAVHPSGARGVAHVRLLGKPESLASTSAQLTSVVGEPPRSNATGSECTWTLDVPSDTTGTQKPRLILSAPTNDEEQDHLATKGAGIFEVGFLVGSDGVERESRTPYGKVVWLRS